MLKNTYSHYSRNFVVCSIYYMVFGVAVGNIVMWIMNRQMTLEYFIMGSGGIVFYSLYEAFSANKYVKADFPVGSNDVKLLVALNKHMKNSLESIEAGTYPLKITKYPYHLKVEIAIHGDSVELTCPKKMMESIVNS